MSFFKSIFKKAPIGIGQVFQKKENFYQFVKEEMTKALYEEKSGEIGNIIEKHSFESSLLQDNSLWHLLLGDGYDKFLCQHIPTLLSARFGEVFIKSKVPNITMMEFMMVALKEMDKLTHDQVRFLRENMHLPSIVINDVEVFMEDDALKDHASKQLTVALEMDRRRDPEKRGMDVDEIHNRKMNFFNMSYCILQTIK
jgi:glutaredoxin